MCRKARARWVGVAGKIKNACVRTAHTLHEGDGFLGFAVDCRSSEKKKKQPAQPIFLAEEPLTPTATRPLSRGRELERGQQAARLVFGRLGCWERLPPFGRMPSPQPSPTGEGASCGRFKCCKSSEKKNARNINGRNFSGSLYHKANGTNAASVFSDDL